MAVGYEGELQLSQFDIINTKYRQVSSCHLSVSCQQTLVISARRWIFHGRHTRLGVKNISISIKYSLWLIAAAGELLPRLHGDVLGAAGGLPAAEAHRILPYPGEGSWGALTTHWRFFLAKRMNPQLSNINTANLSDGCAAAGVCAVHSDCGAQLGRILVEQRGDQWQSRLRWD